jgi:hypothetical protein
MSRADVPDAHRYWGFAGTSDEFIQEDRVKWRFLISRTPCSTERRGKARENERITVANPILFAHHERLVVDCSSLDANQYVFKAFEGYGVLTTGQKSIRHVQDSEIHLFRILNLTALACLTRTLKHRIRPALKHAFDLRRFRV